jgi:hypothetical protein
MQIFGLVAPPACGVWSAFRLPRRWPSLPRPCMHKCGVSSAHRDPVPRPRPPRPAPAAGRHPRRGPVGLSGRGRFAARDPRRRPAGAARHPGRGAGAVDHGRPARGRAARRRPDPAPGHRPPGARRRQSGQRPARHRAHSAGGRPHRHALGAHRRHPGPPPRFQRRRARRPRRHPGLFRPPGAGPVRALGLRPPVSQRQRRRTQPARQGLGGGAGARGQPHRRHPRPGRAGAGSLRRAVPRRPPRQAAGEALAFDAEGWLLSESRHAEDARPARPGAATAAAGVGGAHRPRRGGDGGAHGRRPARARACCSTPTRTTSAATASAPGAGWPSTISAWRWKCRPARPTPRSPTCRSASR